MKKENIFLLLKKKKKSYRILWIKLSPLPSNHRHFLIKLILEWTALKSLKLGGFVPHYLHQRWPLFPSLCPQSQSYINCLPLFLSCLTWWVVKAQNWILKENNASQLPNPFFWNSWAPRTDTHPFSAFPTYRPTPPQPFHLGWLFSFFFSFSSYIFSFLSSHHQHWHLLKTKERIQAAKQWISICPLFALCACTLDCFSNSLFHTQSYQQELFSL